MPPKKKASEAAAPSALYPPPPEQTGDGADAGGRTSVDEGAHGAARSKDKAALPISGVAGSHNDRAHSKTRRPYMHRAHLRRRGTGSVMVLIVPCVCWIKIELVDLGVLKTSTHANMLARARHGHLDGILLLLT